MEEHIDIISEQEIKEEKNYFLQTNLLSDHQIYSLLKETKKLNGGEVYKEVVSVLSDIIYHVYTRLNKTPNLKSDILRNQSPRQLFTQEEVFFMNTCLDYSLLTLQYMKSAGFKNNSLVIDELKTPFPGFFKLHFGVEGIHDGKTYYIDHKSNNLIFIGEGNFVSDYADIGEHIANTIKIPGEKIGFDDTFFNLYDKGLISFEHFSPDLLPVFKKKFQEDNTPEERNKFIRKVQHPKKPEIIVKDNLI